MKVFKHQTGSSHVVIVLAIVVVAVVAFAGYRVLHTSSENSTGTTVSNNSASVPSKISNKADVAQASKALDSTNPDSVNPDQLNSDLSAL